MKRLFVAVAMLAAIASACGAAVTSATSRGSETTVTSLASVQKEVAGKPVVYLFTAPGCQSCADQAQALAAAAHDRPSVQLVGVDLTNNNSSDFAAYISSIGLATSRFIWTIDTDGGLARRYGIVSLSSSVLVSSDGTVRFINSGPQDEQTLDAQLGQLI